MTTATFTAAALNRLRQELACYEKICAEMHRTDMTTEHDPARYLNLLARHGWHRDGDHWRDAGDEVRDADEAMRFATRLAGIEEAEDAPCKS